MAKEKKQNIEGQQVSIPIDVGNTANNEKIVKNLNIHQRMLAVMGDLDYIQKEQKKVNGQYTFASHDAVTAALHPLFVKHGILALPNVRTAKQDGNRTELSIAMTFYNVDDPTQFVEVVMVGFGVDPGDKGPGKATSYAVKYAFLKAFCLETGDDPDKDANIVHEPANNFADGEASEKQVKAFLATWGDNADQMNLYIDEVAETKDWSRNRTVTEMMKNRTFTEKRFKEWMNGK